MARCRVPQEHPILIAATRLPPIKFVVNRKVTISLNVLEGLSSLCVRNESVIHRVDKAAHVHPVFLKDRTKPLDPFAFAINKSPALCSFLISL